MLHNSYKCQSGGCNEDLHEIWRHGTINKVKEGLGHGIIWEVIFGFVGGLAR